MWEEYFYKECGECGRFKVCVRLFLWVLFENVLNKLVRIKLY